VLLVRSDRRLLKRSTRLLDNMTLRMKRSTELRDKVKKSIFAIALTAPFVASIPSVRLAADADLPVGQRAARHYRVPQRNNEIDQTNDDRSSWHN
jgi:hypothetical protein